MKQTKKQPVKGWHWTISLHKSSQPDRVFTRDLSPAVMMDLADEMARYGEDQETECMTEILTLLGEAGAIEPMTETLSIHVRVPVKGLSDAQRVDLFEKQVSTMFPGVSVEDHYRY